MNDIIDIPAITEAASGIKDWLFANVLVTGSLLQILAVGALFGVALFLTPRLKLAIAKVKVEGAAHPRLRRAAGVLEPLGLPIVWLVLQWLAMVSARQAGWSNHIMVIAVSLLSAWVVIRLLASIISDRVWSRTLTVMVWTLAALNIVDLLGPTVDLLDSLSVSVGAFRISVLGILKLVMLLAVFLWGASAAARLAERRLSSVVTISPTAQVLVGKILRIALYTLAVLVVLNSVGIDLTALAVFSGAVGLGIGFGLQKVFSNLISGFILLLDKSVKPGDVIAIGQTYGWINKLSARYASVITRDGVEHLIPNEELITQRVENWSFSSTDIRLRLPLGISYNSDPHLAIDVILEEMDKHQRVLAEPPPNCLVMGFGDSSVNLEVRFWVSDPANGTGNIKSELYLAIWDAFKANGIEIPFPQRDIHIKSSEGRTFTLDQVKDGENT